MTKSTTTTTERHRMRRDLVRTLLAGVAAATLGSCTFGSLAIAEDAKVNSMSFEVSSPYKMAIVTVTSSDGKTWDTILPGEVGFHAIMQVDTAGRGYVERAGIFLGKCSNTGCANHRRVFAEQVEQRDYNKSRNITFSVDQLKAAAPGIFGQSYGETILAECNKGLTDDGANKPHTKLIAPDASFTVNTRKGNPGKVEVVEEGTGIAFDGGDHTRHGAFLVQIECKATARTAAQPDSDPPPKVVDGINLFLATYTVPQASPRGTTCKPLKVTTRIETGKAGPKNVKLWRQVNGGPITSETRAMDAEALGGGKFGDDWNKFEHFTKTTTVQYKAEMLDGTFAPSTPWKSITIHCNGNYAPPTNPDPNDPPRGRPTAELPPVIVTPPPSAPPPMCGTKAAKVRGSAPCIKVAPVPDKRQQWADQKRKQAEDKRRAAREADVRRREAALKTAEMQRRQQTMNRPFGFGRFGAPARPMAGRPLMMNLRYHF